MITNNIKVLSAAFSPSQGMWDPERFAGRSSEVESLAESLYIDGSVPMIYGGRGLGKSSLALQLSRIAQGDQELLFNLGLNELSLDADDSFITVNVTCTDEVKTYNDLLKKIIYGLEDMTLEKADQPGRENYYIVSRSENRKLSLKFFKKEANETFESERKRILGSEETLENKTISLADALFHNFGQRVFVIIDEFDRVGESRGFASFLKSNSSSALKFAVVGIAKNHSELLSDHESLDRQISPVEVKTMDREELREIVTTVEKYLSGNSIPMTFSDSAIEKMIEMAQGYPWYIHLIGYATLMRANKLNINNIDLDCVEQCIEDLPKNKFAAVFNEKYEKAVGTSAARETVLRVFAASPTSVIRSTDMYEAAKAQGVASPAQYVGHLKKKEHGEILEGIGNSRMYRFSDSMFKVFVNLRNRVYGAS